MGKVRELLHVIPKDPQNLRPSARPYPARMEFFPGIHKAPPQQQPDDPLPDWLSPTATSHVCPTCSDAAAIESAGADMVCQRCGTIVDTPLDWTAEYRYFSNDAHAGGPDPSRCGFPVNHLMPESSLGTVILNKGSSPLMRRIKRYHMWNLMPYRERTLWSIFDSLNVRATNAGISSAVIEEAKELFAQLTASVICRGQAQRDAMLAACLWEALKRHDAPRLPRDIAAIFQIPIRQATKGIKQFQHILAIRTAGDKKGTYANPSSPAPVPSAEPEEATADVIAARAAQRRAKPARTTTYEDFIAPFLTNLSLGAVAPAMNAAVRHVCARAEELGVVPESTPPSLTAAAIAFAAAELGVRVENTELARVCGISAVTVQKCVKRMGPWRQALLEGLD